MSDSLPNKEELYAEFQREQKWRSGLARRLAHKAVDIPVDDMQIQVSNRGFGWKELLVVAVMVVGSGLLAWSVSRREPPPAGSQEQEFEVRFYDSQGRLIDVPRRLPEGTSGAR